MSEPTCPVCTMTEVLEFPDHWECVTCAHEWSRQSKIETEPEQARVVKDANGNVLVEGDSIVLIKDLPLKGSSGVLKGGTKAKNIHLVEGDHEITCKINGSTVGLKACFVKKG